MSAHQSWTVLIFSLALLLSGLYVYSRLEPTVANAILTVVLLALAVVFGSSLSVRSR